MGTPHVHAEVIKAWADGKQIQFYDDGQGTWLDMHCTPGWYEDSYYRVKPETVRYRVALLSAGTISTSSDTRATTIEGFGSFVRWLTPWVEVEV